MRRRIGARQPWENPHRSRYRMILGRGGVLSKGHEVLSMLEVFRSVPSDSTGSGRMAGRRSSSAAWDRSVERFLLVLSANASTIPFPNRMVRQRYARKFSSLTTSGGESSHGVAEMSCAGQPYEGDDQVTEDEGGVMSFVRVDGPLSLVLRKSVGIRELRDIRVSPPPSGAQLDFSERKSGLLSKKSQQQVSRLPSTSSSGSGRTITLTFVGQSGASRQVQFTVASSETAALQAFVWFAGQLGVLATSDFDWAVTQLAGGGGSADLTQREGSPHLGSRGHWQFGRYSVVHSNLVQSLWGSLSLQAAYLVLEYWLTMFKANSTQKKSQRIGTDRANDRTVTPRGAQASLLDPRTLPVRVTGIPTMLLPSPLSRRSCDALVCRAGGEISATFVALVMYTVPSAIWRRIRRHIRASLRSQLRSAQAGLTDPPWVPHAHAWLHALTVVEAGGRAGIPRTGGVRRHRFQHRGEDDDGADGSVSDQSSSGDEEWKGSFDSEWRPNGGEGEPTDNVDVWPVSGKGGKEAMGYTGDSGPATGLWPSAGEGGVSSSSEQRGDAQRLLQSLGNVVLLDPVSDAVEEAMQTAFRGSGLPWWQAFRLEEEFEHRISALRARTVMDTFVPQASLDGVPVPGGESIAGAQPALFHVQTQSLEAASRDELLSENLQYLDLWMGMLGTHMADMRQQIAQIEQRNLSLDMQDRNFALLRKSLSELLHSISLPQACRSLLDTPDWSIRRGKSPHQVNSCSRAAFLDAQVTAYKRRSSGLGSPLHVGSRKSGARSKIGGVDRVQMAGKYLLRAMETVLWKLPASVRAMTATRQQLGSFRKLANSFLQQSCGQFARVLSTAVEKAKSARSFEPMLAPAWCKTSFTQLIPELMLTEGAAVQGSATTTEQKGSSLAPGSSAKGKARESLGGHAMTANWFGGGGGRVSGSTLFPSPLEVTALRAFFPEELPDQWVVLGLLPSLSAAPNAAGCIVGARPWLAASCAGAGVFPLPHLFQLLMAQGFQGGLSSHALESKEAGEDVRAAVKAIASTTEQTVETGKSLGADTVRLLHPFLPCLQVHAYLIGFRRLTALCRRMETVLYRITSRAVEQKKAQAGGRTAGSSGKDGNTLLPSWNCLPYYHKLMKQYSDSMGGYYSKCVARFFKKLMRRLSSTDEYNASLRARKPYSLGQTSLVPAVFRSKTLGRMRCSYRVLAHLSTEWPERYGFERGLLGGGSGVERKRGTSIGDTESSRLVNELLPGDGSSVSRNVSGLRGSSGQGSYFEPSTSYLNEPSSRLSRAGSSLLRDLSGPSVHGGRGGGQSTLKRSAEGSLHVKFTFVEAWNVSIRAVLRLMLEERCLLVTLLARQADEMGEGSASVQQKAGLDALLEGWAKRVYEKQEPVFLSSWRTMCLQAVRSGWLPGSIMQEDDAEQDGWNGDLSRLPPPGESRESDGEDEEEASPGRGLLVIEDDFAADKERKTSTSTVEQSNPALAADAVVYSAIEFEERVAGELGAVTAHPNGVRAVRQWLACFANTKNAEDGLRWAELYNELFQSYSARERVECDRMMSGMLLSAAESGLGSLLTHAGKMDALYPLYAVLVLGDVLQSLPAACTVERRLFSSLHGKASGMLNDFIEQECTWISKSRFTARQAGVVAPVARLPGFVRRVQCVLAFCQHSDAKSTTEGKGRVQPSREGDSSSSNDKSDQDPAVQCVDIMFRKLCRTLFSWLEAQAAEDTKYTNVVLMENYHFLYHVLKMVCALPVKRTLALQAQRHVRQKSGEDGSSSMEEEDARVIDRHMRIYKSLYRFVDGARESYEHRVLRYADWHIRYEMKDPINTLERLHEKVIALSLRRNEVSLSHGLTASNLNSMVNKHFARKTLGKSMQKVYSRLRKHLQRNEVCITAVWEHIVTKLRGYVSQFREDVESCYPERFVGKWMPLCDPGVVSELAAEIRRKDKHLKTPQRGQEVDYPSDSGPTLVEISITQQ